MLIRVMYADGRVGMIKPHLLDRLLEGKIVTSFQRADGWAVVGRDIIRRHHGTHAYNGADRRDGYMSTSPLGKELTLKLLHEFTWVAGVLVLASILMSGFL